MQVEMRDMKRREERGACMDAVKPKMYSEFQVHSKSYHPYGMIFSYGITHWNGRHALHRFHMENLFLMENGIFLNLL